MLVRLRQQGLVPAPLLTAAVRPIAWSPMPTTDTDTSPTTAHPVEAPLKSHTRAGSRSPSAVHSASDQVGSVLAATVFMSSSGMPRGVVMSSRVHALLRDRQTLVVQGCRAERSHADAATVREMT